MSVGRGRKTVGRKVHLGNDKLSVSVGGDVVFEKEVKLGANTALPAAVEEGIDTAATLAALITALDAAGIIDYTETE